MVCMDGTFAERGDRCCNGMGKGNPSDRPSVRLTLHKTRFVQRVSVYVYLAGASLSEGRLYCQ
jgi:hypothetical protein